MYFFYSISLARLKESFSWYFSFVLCFLLICSITASAQSPTITSFTPSTGSVGTLVTITGTNLSNPTSVTIAGVSAIIISNTGTSLVAMVMPGATTGLVSIAKAGGTVNGTGNFILTATPHPSTQQGSKLVGTSNAVFAYQGCSVSVSADGNTAIVGGYADNSNQGAAWVYTRTGGTWTQQGSKLVGTGSVGAARQGFSVSISADGNTAIVGGNFDFSSQGAAWVYTRTGGTWTQQGSKLVGTSNVGAAGQGRSVSLSADGNTAIVGGFNDNSDQGAAWVYIRTGGTWTQQGSKLVGTGNTGPAKQGTSVSLSADGNTAIIGGYSDNSDQGAAWVYTRTGGTWTQQGSKLVGTVNVGVAYQGYSVSLSADGNTAIVGGFNDDGAKGAAWVYTRTGGTWTQQGSKLVGMVYVGPAYHGSSVSLSADGNTAIVGGLNDNSIQGAAWVYTRTGGTWTQQGSKLVGTGNVGPANQGTSVSLSADGNTVIIGGSSDNSNLGASWVYFAASSDATLSGLSISSGTLSPVFSSGTLGYTASVSNATTTLTVTPTGNQANATIKVNGTTVASGSSSGPISLNVGSNTITTVVTAQDGTTTNTYTVTVTRAASSDATLSGLSISSGTLSPVFASGTFGYTALVSNGTTTVTVTPTVTQTNATIKVNGTTVVSGSSSGPISLSVGSNTITTVVTAQDGITTNTYTITVTRAASADASLSALSISSGTLSPVFSSGTLGYTASVSNATTTLTVTPTVNQANATIKVNGTTVASGSSSVPISLNVGSNTITTVVTAQDGTTTNTYTVTVTRAASSDATLSGLSISSGTLSPVFSSGTLGYTASVSNATTTLTVTPTVNQANATIKVNGTTVASGSSSGPISLNVGSNTITTVVTAQDGTTTNTYTIIVTRSLPDITGNTNICVGRSINLANAVTGGAWRSANTFIATIDNNGLVTGVSAGTVLIDYTVTDSLGQKNTVTTTVIVNALPEVGFVIPEVCLNEASAQFTDTTKIADGSTNFTYLWDFNAGTPAVSPGPNTKTSTVQNPSVKYNKAANYKVSLTVTSKGCVASLAKDFPVNGANPTAFFEVQKPTELCSNDSVRIKNKSTVDFGNVTRLEIFWDSNDLTKKTTDEDPYFGKDYAYRYPDFQTPATKTYAVKLVAYSANAPSCSKSTTQTITFNVNASPKVAFSTMPGICNEAAARQITQTSFDAQVPGTFAYTGKGVSSSGLFNAQTAGAGTFAIKYLYTSNKGCQDSATKNITIWPSPLANWTVSNPACQKNDILFTDSSVANFSKIIQRNWNYDDGTAVSTRTNNTTYSRQFAIAKTYNISLQVITDSGCKSALNVQPVKVNYLPKPDVSLPSICLPDGKGQFTNQSSIDDGSQALFSYLWNFNDPNDRSSSTLKEPVHKYSALGPYTVQLKVTTKDGCIDSLTRSLITIYPQPKGNFTITPAALCLGDTVNFKDMGNGMSSVATAWFWDLGNGSTSTTKNPLKQYNDSGIFTISYYFFNAQGCVSDTTSKQITVYPYPKLVLGPNLKVLEGGVITIKPKLVYGTALQYLWVPSLYLNSDTSATPKSALIDDITYKLILTGKGGCSISDTIFIQVLKSPEVPNAFSPNGDGINDTWRIKYIESYPGAVIEVYNRYGQMVFHSIGYDVDWDGTYNGNPMAVGTYYYIINPKNGRQIITGSVTIIK